MPPLKKVNSQQRKGRWTQAEDNLLRSLVAEYNVNENVIINWAQFESHFNGTRNSKQIRERWCNHINPTIEKRKFNDDEIKMIEKEFLTHKFQWVKIAKRIQGTSPLMIKNFYYNNLRKKNPVKHDNDVTIAKLATIPLIGPHHDSRKSEKMSLSTILN